MTPDFWAGYISGAVGILIGNPLDVLKVRLQASHTTPVLTPVPPPPPAHLPQPSSCTGPGPSPPPALAPPPRPALPPPHFRTIASLATGAAAPVLGYGALNALLFVSYNRSLALLSGHGPDGPGSLLPPPHPPPLPSLGATFLAGAVGGLATWFVSAPTELVKCRAQLAPAPAPATRTDSSSWAVARTIWRREGLRGFYLGGAVTAARDSVGYGFYFWSYELSTRWMAGLGLGLGLGRGLGPDDDGGSSSAAAGVLLCGGLAGVVTWASIFPLDVVKTRVQTQAESGQRGERTALLGNGHGGASRRAGAVEVTRQAYREGGARVFFRGLGVCSVRAFVVNAAQWAVYEWIMHELGHRRLSGSALVDGI